MFPPLAIPLAIVFGAYVALIMIFAHIYYYVFKRDPSAYSFASALVRKQAVTFGATAGQQLRDGRRVLELLDAACAQLEATPTLDAQYVKNWWNIFGPGRWRADLQGITVAIEREVYATPMAGLMAISHAVSITGVNGESFTRTFTEGPSAEPDLRRLLSLWRSSRARENAELESQLGSIDSEEPQIWAFGDFLYFSTITQTTVGYGDILPNSTRVRKLVSIQILLGYVLLVVIINLVISAQAGGS
jgi:hypothetical protein